MREYRESRFNPALGFTIPRRLAIAARVASLGTAVALAGHASAATDPAALHSRNLFDYNPHAALDIRDAGSTREGAVTVHDLSFTSPKGGRVPAYLVVPHAGRTLAGLILQHGLPGSRSDMLAEAKSLSRRGAVVIAIDAPFARRDGPPIHFDARDRREQIQLIVDLRRAVDLLTRRPDVDPKRIGYVGISYGGAIGGLLAGVEPRIAAFVLAVADGGIIHHYTGRKDGAPLPPMTKQRYLQWVQALAPIEPQKYIARHRAPILFQSGRLDDLVPADDAKQLQQATPPPKTVKWYPSGHRLPAVATCDAIRWLGQYIGLRTIRPACPERRRG